MDRPTRKIRFSSRDFVGSRGKFLASRNIDPWEIKRLASALTSTDRQATDTPYHAEIDFRESEDLYYL